MFMKFIFNLIFLRALLQMLLNFTCDCPAASNMIASKPLMTCVLKQFNYFRSQIKVKIKASSLFALNFNLLSNMSISGECRAHYWKGKPFWSLMSLSSRRVHHTVNGNVQY